MRICGTCDDAMKDFRTALLLGREDDAMAAYKTGCVNTETPYSIYHGEVSVLLTYASIFSPLDFNAVRDITSAVIAGTKRLRSL